MFLKLFLALVLIIPIAQVTEEHQQEPEEVTPPSVVEEPAPLCPCTLTDEMLERFGDQEKMRVLTAMGGLFYAGQLSAVQPPDVYAITLDGERGNRPHIMSREEILRDAVSIQTIIYFYFKTAVWTYSVLFLLNFRFSVGFGKIMKILCNMTKLSNC